MKYPIKYKGEKVELKFPIKLKDIDKWVVVSLSKDGTVQQNGIASYEKENHCWRPCLAFNKRVGYKKKQVKKLIKKYYVEKKEKKKKRKKNKS